ncbi:uncharacterized protein LOC110861358 [Folsomia candida]|uniref:uncharacterized protein LOC110861358 n=1 Tax=Folsomia candida TaxID=158441 RepID=UPI001604E0C8|nr:uncharacterized protein LOC110861358 [Folsomia candida]
MLQVACTYALKIFCLGTTFIAAVIGTNAHVNCAQHKLWENCKDIDPSLCLKPQFWMEIVFIAFSWLVIVGSILNILWACLCTPDGKQDSGCQSLAGILTLISGALIIAAAVQIDNAHHTDKLPEAFKTEVRKADLYIDKIAAGALSLLASVLYFSSAGTLCM